MSNAQWRKAKGKRDTGGFVAMTYTVLCSEEFAALSSVAVKLLMDLLAQYRGNNNGDLAMPWSRMVRRGWKSRDTLTKARKELLARRWIVVTAQGGLHRPSLYAVTMFALDPCSKIEVSAQSFPRGAWKRQGRQNASPNTPIGSNGSRTNTPVVPIEPAVLPSDTPDVRVSGVIAT